MYTVIWFQVLLVYTSNSIPINSFKSSKWLNSSIYPIHRTQTGTTILGQSGPGSNCNERVLHSPKFLDWSLTIRNVVSYPRHLLGVESYLSAEMQSTCSMAQLSPFLAKLRLKPNKKLIEPSSPRPLTNPLTIMPMYICLACTCKPNF